MSAYSITTRGLPQGTLTPMGALLFAASEPGAWYDPSDISTLFQDSAGSTPVTAVEQPVGRMLDKSGRGNHATQATTTKRPVYSRRVALNLKSEYPGGVADAPGRNGLVSASSIPDFLGGTALAFGHDGVTASYAYRQDFTPTAGVAYELSAFVKMDDGGVPQFGGPSGSATNVFEFVLSSTPVVPSLNTYVVSTTEVPGIYRVRVTALAPSASLNCGVVKYASNSSRTFKITGFNVRLATDAHLPYQRVNTATDYDADPAKFPAYLRFDGVDDAMQTGNIDFTSTDKMTVWAGLQQSVATGYGCLLELSANNSSTNGSLNLFVPSGVSSITYGARGTTEAARGIATTSPANYLATSVLNLAGTTRDESILARLNGIAFPGAGGGGNLLGGGVFGNHPLYIGARAASSLYFNGRLYSLIVRGAQSSLSQIEATEAYIKQKMRLP